MASKKLRPGSFKSGSGKSRSATRRTGRTAGTSQSAFAGYGFQGQHPATQTPAAAPPDAEQESPEESPDKSPADQAEQAAEEKPQNGVEPDNRDVETPDRQD